MTERASRNPSASAVMMMDVITTVLSRPDDLDYTTRQLSLKIRELTGARATMLAAAGQHTVIAPEYRIMDIDPSRYAAVLETEEGKRLVEIAQGLDQVTLWRSDTGKGEAESILTRMGFSSCLAMPLMAHGETSGVILSLGLMDEGFVGPIMELQDVLSKVVSIVLKNSLLIEHQQRMCEELEAEVAERKQAEEEREQLRNQLLQAQKMEAIGTLTGGIAHDFNNLLTIINGYAELILSDKTEDDPIYADLQKILSTGRMGAEMVQRLLLFSKKVEITPRPLDTNRIVEDSINLMKRTFPKMIQIEAILGEKLAKINVDASQIEQVLMNLCINAKEAMPEGGRLRIETGNTVIDEEYCRLHFGSRTGQYVLIEISDTGLGITKDIMERIFDPFFTTKGWDFKKGTGLGLSVTKGFVEKHGGWITCESEPGKGSIFRIYLPAIGESATARKAESGPPAVPQIGKILLVDDENFLLGLAKRILERAGYEVITASNGKEALDVYAREGSGIGLVVLDLIMPQMGGRKCLEELLGLNPDVKVLISSGHSLTQDEQASLSAYVKGFVNKPYQLKNLLSAVKDALG